MKKPENLTLRHYWEANSSEERIKIIEDAFAWIEHLEEVQGKIEVIQFTPTSGMRVDVLPVPFMKKGEAYLLVHPDNYPGKLEIKTDHGPLSVLHSKLLKHGEIGIMDLSYDPLKLGDIRPSECDILAYDDGSVSCCTCGLEGQSIFDIDCKRRKTNK